MGTPRAIERRARASSAAERGRAPRSAAASRACSRAIWAVSGLRIERVGMGLEAERRSGIYPALSHRQASFSSAAVFPDRWRDRPAPCRAGSRPRCASCS